MKILIEIAGIVTKKKVKKIEIFDDYALRQKNSKFNEFFESLAANRFKNDRDAAMHLYGCSPLDAKYRQLKSRFRKRLLNTLFFLDINKPSTSNYEQAYFTCNKEWAIVKILMANHAFHAATSVAKGVLSTALKYQFADIIVNSSRILREYYANLGEEKEYELYDGYSKQYSDILEAEIKSEEYYQRVLMQYRKPLYKSDGLVRQIDACCNDLITLSETFHSPVINYNMFLVWIMRYEMMRDFDSMLEICNQAEAYVASNPQYYQEEKQIVFHTKKMAVFLHMGDYRQGRINAEKCLNTFSEGSAGWFHFMEYYMLSALQTGQYFHAAAIVNQVASIAEYKKLEGLEKEKWAIFEAYTQYFAEKAVNAPQTVFSRRKRPIRTSRYLDDPAQFPRDQRNLAVLVWVLNVMQLIDKRNFAELNDLLEQLKVFATRQLDQDEHFRAIQFIRLLQQLRKAGYQPDNITNADKYYNRLVDRPFLYRGAVSELEIIPYEKLWEMVLANFR